MWLSDAAQYAMQAASLAPWTKSPPANPGLPADCYMAGLNATNEELVQFKPTNGISFTLSGVSISLDGCAVSGGMKPTSYPAGKTGVITCFEARDSSGTPFARPVIGSEIFILQGGVATTTPEITAISPTPTPISIYSCIVTY